MIALGLLLCSIISAQDARTPAAGKFLIAARQLGDPNFYQTVILLLRYDSRGALGLVINEPTKIPLSKLFDQVKGTKERSDVVYLGGPVDRSVAYALLRAKTKPEEGSLLVGDVYFASSRTFIERALESGTPPQSFRLYLGYAGWGAGQLDYEVEAGAWHIVRPDLDAIFEENPVGLWERMIRRTQLRTAQLKEALAPMIASAANRPVRMQSGTPMPE